MSASLAAPPLAAEAERLRLACEARGLGVHEIDLASGRIACDARTLELWGLAGGEPLHLDTLLGCLHPDDRGPTRDALEGAAAPGGDGRLRVEYRVVDASGAVQRCVLATGRVRGADDRPARLVATAEDVTEARRAEEARAQREQEIWAVTDSIPALISYVDTEQRYRFMNRQYEAWFGHDRSEVLGRTMTQILGEPAMERLAPYVACALAGEAVRFELETPYRDGGTRWIDAHYVPDRDAEGRVRGFFALVRDVTERMQAAKALRDSEARLSATLAQIPLGVGVVDADGRLVASNELFRGYVPDQIPSRDPERRARWRAFDAHGQPVEPSAWPGALALRGEPASAGMDFLFTGDDGDERWLRVAAAPLRDSDGALAGAIAIAQDVTSARRAEQALRDNERRLRLAMEVAEMGGWEWDLETDEMVWSPETQRLFGIEAGTPISFETFLAWVHPEDLEAHRRAAREVHRSGRYELEYRVTRPDGSTRRFAMRGRVLPQAPSESRLVGVVADVTARHEAEEARRESESRFRVMADSSPLVIWVTDPEGNLQFVNEAYGRFFGIAQEDVSGPNWQPLLHPEDAPLYVSSFLEALEKRRPWACDARVRRADGAWRWIESRTSPRFADSGRFLGCVGTSTDVTERVEAEQALREADRRKDEFVATLAHELRNPLAPIRNAVEILHLEAGEAAVRAAREIIERQVGHMVRLVDDLLDVSRITRGKLELRRRRIALAAIVEQALETVRPFLRSGGQHLSVSLPSQSVWLDADPVRLAQVLANLLNNASKYTDPGGRIWLTAYVEGAEAVVTVRDTGIGIPAEHLPHLFETFSQVSSALERSQGGLGIGLSLARGLVEMHGGRIDARSEGPGHGSEFVVRLPLVDAAQAAEATADAAGPGLEGPPRRRRILVADDNRDAAESLAILLRLAGNEVETVHDGYEAVAAAERFRPHVLLLDLGMPGLNGLQVCRQLREQPWGRPIAVIAQTGWGAEADRQRTAAAGFDAHLVKPVDIATVGALIEKLQPRGTPG